ncbi:hypothetical protein [Thermosulfidibacter takaii]|nr:hypothetical protein [Thermosulfidibacter takaii]
MKTFQNLKSTKVDAQLVKPQWVWIEYIDHEPCVFYLGNAGSYGVSKGHGLLSDFFRACISFLEEKQESALLNFAQNYGPLVYNLRTLHKVLNNDIHKVTSSAFEFFGYYPSTITKRRKDRNNSKRVVTYQDLLFFIREAVRDGLNTNLTYIMLLSKQQLYERFRICETNSNIDNSMDYLGLLKVNTYFGSKEVVAEDKELYIVIGEPIEMLKEIFGWFLDCFKSYEETHNPADFNDVIVWLNEEACFRFEPDGTLKFKINTLMGVIIYQLLNALVSKRFEVKKCKTCGKLFIASRKDQLYCSNACRYIAFTSRQDQKEN